MIIEGVGTICQEVVEDFLIGEESKRSTSDSYSDEL